MTTLQDYLLKLTENKYVKDVLLKQQKILYKPEFYKELNDLLKQGLSAVEAYNKLGFDTSVLGEDRAYACAKRCKNYKEKIDEKLIVKYLKGEMSEAEFEKMNDSHKLVALKEKINIYEVFLEHAKKNNLL